MYAYASLRFKKNTAFGISTKIEAAKEKKIKYSMGAKFCNGIVLVLKFSDSFFKGTVTSIEGNFKGLLKYGHLLQHQLSHCSVFQ